MATKTFTVTKQMMAAVGSDSFGGGTANPGDDHIPIGRWAAGTGLSWVTRAALYAPVSFTGMTGINAARLYLYQHTAAGFHAKGSGTKGVTPYRKTSDWSESSAGTSTANDEVWGGDGSAIVVSGYSLTSEDGSSDFSTTAADGTLDYVDITEIVRDWHGGSANYGVMIRASSGAETTDTSDAMEFYSRHVSGKQPYIWIDYDTNTAPNAPTSLNPNGNEIVNTGTAIVVSGARSDPDSGDYITGVDLRMYKDDGTTQVDTDTYYPTGSPTTFSRTMTVPNGHAYYRWIARTRDRENVWGAWTAQQRFKANTVPSTPTRSITAVPTTDIKTLTPTFSITRNDADGAYGDQMASFQIDLETSAGTQVFDSGEIAVGSGTVTINYVYAGPALSWSTDYRWRARTKDENGAWSAWSTYATFDTYNAGVPISLAPTGNEVTSTLTPTLTGSRSTTDYTITNYEIELYESNGTTLKWSSGVLATGITNGATFSKVYNGAALSFATQYKWRSRVTGNIGGTSAWSALQTFTTRTADEVEQTAPVGSPITSLTPNFTGTWTTTLNARQIILYAADGTTQIWDSGEDTQTASTSFSTAYDGTALAWNTMYKWKARVRRSADNVWQPYSGLAEFTTDSAGQPTLTAPINDSWQTTLTPTFTGTTFSAEVITTFRIRLYESDGTTLVWDSGDLAGSGTSFSKVYNGANALNAGRTYKWQARYIKSTGPTGNYSALQSFHVNAAPQSPQTSPATGSIVGTRVPVLSSEFSDIDMAAWNDFPTQLEVEVRNNATDALISTFTRIDGLIAGWNDVAFNGANLVTNVGAEVNTTGYSVSNSVLTRDTTIKRTGVASVKVEPLTAAAYSIVISVVIAGATLGRTYYGEMWVYVPEGSTLIGQEIRCYVRETGGATATEQDYTPYTMVSGWQKLTHARTLLRNDRTGVGVFANRVAPVDINDDYWVDDISIREGPLLAYETTYKWRARYLDSKGVAGAWSSYSTIKPSQPSVVDMTAPTGSITSPQVPVTWTFSSPGGKTQNWYQVVVIRNSDEIVVYDSGVVISAATSHIIPAGYLVNNESYTFQITTVDTDGI
jgi:hypothetical protein